MVKRQIYIPSIVLLLIFSVLLVTVGLEVTAADRPEIYLTNRSNGNVLKPYYQFLSLKPLTISLECPHGIACGPGGLLYAAEPSKGRIVRFNQQGKYKEEVVVDEPNSVFSGRPLNLTFGPNGNLFFTTPNKGIWTLEDGDPRNKPERLIKGKYFEAGKNPHDLAFLKAGEYSNDLIVSVLTDPPRKGYILRIPAPDYNQAKPFISEYSYEEMGNRVNQHLRVPIALGVNAVGEIFIAGHEKRENFILRYAPNGEFIDVFVDSIVKPLDLNFASGGKLYATLGPLWPDEPEGGGLKVYSKSGEQELYIPRSNIWGVALCEK
ncbi:hypothetical protein KGY79_11355 [Candidatus Bipolaricaulota bacterium]|nr:hypothetical protein [Candidatus Bipolaricaulota bacterium]